MAGDNRELFQELVQKEKNREELKRAVEATPIRDQWRQILVVSLAVMILGGFFIYRSKRFQTVMNSIENSSLVAKIQKTKMGPKAKGQAPAPVVDPDAAMAKAEKTWAAQVAAANRETSSEQDVAELQSANAAVGKKVEHIASRVNGDTPAGGPAPASTADSAPASSSSHGGDLVGISNATPEPELDAFQIPVAPNAAAYRETTQVPAPYAKETSEFPDVH